MDWISTSARLPAPFVKVRAKDDLGNEFLAMLTSPGDVWAYADGERFGVAAIVKWWRSQRDKG